MFFVCRCLGILLLATGAVFSQGTLEDYRRAQTMLGLQAGPIMFDGQVTPNWIAGEDSFWYLRRSAEGKRFVLVDIARRQKAPAFDHDRLASALTRASGATIKPERLPFDSFRLDAKRQQIRFVINRANWMCHLVTYECGEEARPPARAPEASYFAGFGLGPGLRDSMAVASPDGKWEVVLRDFNLVLRNTATGEETRLTEDGSVDNDYSYSPSSPTLQLRLGASKIRIPPSAYWSPDSSRFVGYRLDMRKSPRLTLVQSARGKESFPFAYSYHAPVAGNPDVAKVIPVAFDVAQKKGIAVKTEPLEWLWTEAGPFRPQWSKDSSRVWFVDATRGFKQVRLREIDARTGETRTLIDENSARHVNYNLAFFNWKRLDSGEVVWISERDGWSHLYLYDSQSAALRRQLTEGAWAVREVVGIGKNRVFFYGSGREPARDPYLQHLYSVDLAGGEPELLTPDPAEHEVSLSPSGAYLVDNYSTINKPWTSVVRDSRDGSVVLELERGDPKPLERIGWTPPEPFEVLAADGKTKLYGVLFRPSRFDRSRKYPVIESVYAFPSRFAAPKGFSSRGGSSTTGAPSSQATAELGFIVVTLDGRGTGLRSREFQDTIYGEHWGDERWEDHVEALRQLARRYPYMDLNRVGIFGHSAGGADAVNAMLLRPDFYKAGVASAGSHAIEVGLALPTEQWAGFPPNGQVFGHSNIALAGRLQGKLLLAHGEVDDNVHPSSTMKLVQALIEANKDFEFLILPNDRHSLGSNLYLIRRRWDFFVKHLLGVDPPKGFDLRSRGRE
jgi:dipeptidyl aminopeptidase/acylaminoacyl peptidase